MEQFTLKELVKRKLDETYISICFLYGKVISDIDFNFIINNKNKSIAIFKIKLLNGSILTVKAYNQLADYCYSRIKKEDIIYIQGYVRSKDIILEFLVN